MLLYRETCRSKDKKPYDNIMRFMNFDVAFDEDAWGRWAETDGLDSRCINFVLTYSNELFQADKQGNRICNPRSFTMFANTISGIKDWDNPENQEFIQLIAKGCFKDEGGKFAQMFGAFLRQKMHTLIKPKDMLLGSWDRIHEILHKTIYDENGKYRADIAALLERRFANYVLSWLGSDEETPISKVKERILNFLDCSEKTNEKLFNQDMLFHMISTITSDFRRQTSSLLYEPRIAKIIS